MQKKSQKKNGHLQRKQLDFRQVKLKQSVWTPLSSTNAKSGAKLSFLCSLLDDAIGALIVFRALLISEDNLVKKGGFFRLSLLTSDIMKESACSIESPETFHKPLIPAVLLYG